MVEPTVRTVRDDELVEAAKVVNHGMLGAVTDEIAGGWAEIIEAARGHGAFSATGRIVGFARQFPTDLAVPGGEVRAAAVTAVAVLSNHRRQGHLTRLMGAQLDAIREEGVPVAVLLAAEWPIYGRFGYGPAVDACRFEVDTATARFRATPSGSIELTDPAALRPALETAHELRRARTPGAIRRDALVWDRLAGVSAWPGHTLEPGRQRGATWHDEAGALQGAVAYTVDDTWHRNRPAGRADVTLLVGATAEAERELWRHLCDIDWIRTVSAGTRGLDDPLPLFLDDGRAAHSLDHSDCVWARILDVPAALGERRSLRPGGAVIEVVDPMGYATGRWQIDLGPDGGEVAPSSATADVTLPVDSLGAAYLGGRSVRRLFDAGWVEEGAAGGVDRLDALLATATAPWSPTTF